MIRCIALDDEPLALDIISNHVSRVPFLQLEASFGDPLPALTYIKDHIVDLLFLDINMPDIDGLQLLRTLQGRRPLVIFTTAHSEYAVQSYEVEAVDYLLKPFDFPRFLLAATRARERLGSASVATGDFFFVNAGNQKRRIACNEIYYIQSEGNYVRYVTKSAEVLVRAGIRDTLNLLPPGGFVQIHRSCIIALQYIDKVEDNHVHIAGKRISISGTCREHFMKVIDSLRR